MKHRVLIGIILLGVLLRLVPFPEMVRGGSVAFVGTDSYYYMWNARQILADYPHIAPIDIYQGFPDGTPSNVSPLFALLIATVSWISGLGSPTPFHTEMSGAILPVAINAATSLLLYLIARRFMEKTEALAATFFFSIVPIQVINTLFGNPDTNALEPLLACICVLLLLIFLFEKRSLFFPLLFGSFLSLSFLLWHAAVFFVVLGCLLTAVYVLAIGKARDFRSLPLMIGALSVHAGILWVMKAADSWGMGLSGQLTTNVALSLAGISLLAFFWGMLKLLSRKDYGYGMLVAISGSSLVAAAVIAYFLAPDAVRGFLEGAGRILFYKDPWHQYIGEMQSLFVKQGKVDFMAPVDMLTIVFYLFPVGVYFLLKDRSINPSGKAIFLAWTGLNFFLAVLHSRFAGMFSLNLAVLFGLSFRTIGGLKRKLAVMGLSALIIVGTAFSSYAILPRFVPYNTIPVTRDLFPALEWMKQNTPPGRDYGVLARWDFGYWIVYRAERPAVAVNSGAGMKTSAVFLTSSDESELMDLFTRNRVRYVIASDVAMALPSMAEIAGRDREAFQYRTMPDGSVTPTAAYFDAISTRLFVNDGNSLREEAEGLHHFRLVYESQNAFPMRGAGREVKQIKVFEVVQGATLVGKAAPGARVEIAASIITNQSRAFTYRNRTTADRDGIYRVVVPYATEGSSSVRITPYRVNFNGMAARVFVSEEAVRDGGEVHVAAS